MHKTKSTCIQNSTVSCLPKLTLDVLNLYTSYTLKWLKSTEIYVDLKRIFYIRDILFGPISTFSMQIINEKHYLEVKSILTVFEWK